MYSKVLTMLEILHRDDINKIQDILLKEYIIYSLNRLPDDFILPEYGYFIIIENFSELESNPIKFSHCELPSVNDDFFDEIELIEVKNDIVEVLFIIHNDFAISLVFYLSILPHDMKNHILTIMKK